MMIFVAIVGVALWFLIFAIRKLVDSIDMSSAARTRIRVLLPSGVFVAWTLFGLWAIERLFAEKSFQPVLLGGVALALAALFVWFLLRDVVAGIIFRTKHPNVLNHHLSVGNMKGKVIGLRSTTLQIQTDSGEQLSFPYSKIAGESITEFARSKTLDRFHFALPVEGDEDPEVLNRELRKELLLIPWVNHHIPPTVRLSSSDGRRVANVSFHCLNDEHASTIQERMRGAAAKREQDYSKKPKR